MEYVTLTKQFLIRAIHNLNNPELSDSVNEKLYGMCYRTHGHDYHVMITVESPIDPNSGVCFDRDKIDTIVNEKIVQKLDGQMLNEIYPNTSGEALSYIFFDLLKDDFKPARLKSVTIQETRKNWFGCSQS